MSKYPARNVYQNKCHADEYDVRRFTSFRGKLLDKLEKRDVLRCMSAAFSDHSRESIHVLDIPCGTGRITKTLLDAGYQASGADISNEMMDVASNRLSNYPGFNGLYKEDIEKLSFKDSSFDAVTCIRLMGHLPMESKIAAIKELARVSKEYVIVAFYISNTGYKIKRSIKNKLFNNPAPWYPLTRSEVESLAGECGLKVVTCFDVLKLYSEASTYLLKVI